MSFEYIELLKTLQVQLEFCSNPLAGGQKVYDPRIPPHPPPLPTVHIHHIVRLSAKIAYLRIQNNMKAFFITCSLLIQINGPFILSSLFPVQHMHIQKSDLCRNARPIYTESDNIYGGLAVLPQETRAVLLLTRHLEMR